MKPALDECNHNGRTEAIISVWAGSKTPQSDLSIRFRQKENAGEKKVVPKVKAVAFKILTIPTSKNSSSTPTVTASPSTASKSALNTNPPDNKDAPVHTTATFTTTITRPTVTSSPMVVAAAAAPRASVTFSAVPSGTPTQIPSSGPRLW